MDDAHRRGSGRIAQALRVALVTLVVAGCGSVSVTLPEDIGSDFDLDAVLVDLRDCDALGDAFVSVVRTAADDLDALAEESEGSVPAADLAAKVDVVVGTGYYQVAERIGCDMVRQRVDTLDRLRSLDPSSAAGEELIAEVTRDLERSAGTE